MKRFAFCAVACVLSVSSARAEDEPTPLSEVVVTATGQPVSLSNVLPALTVITRDEIERAQVGDLAELLRFVAGVEIARNGGPGQVTSVFIRGGESNHTLVLIDGIRVNPATAGGAALQNISPEMIERIEILRGPRATLYGSDAIAGVINVITRVADGLHADAAARGGSYDTRDVAGSVSYGVGDHGIALSAQHEEIGGFPSCRGAADDRGYRNTTVNAKARSSIAGVSVGARAWDTRGQSEYFDFCGGTPVDQDFHNQVIAADAGVRPVAAWQSRLSISRMVDDIRQNQDNFLGQQDFVRTTRPRLAWENSLDLPHQRLSAGLEAAREQVDALQFGTPIHEDRDLFGVFAQDEIDVDRHSAVLAAAFHDHDAFGDQFTWNAEYGYRFPTETRLTTAAGTGFRAPDATDRFGFGGNPDLKAESSRSYELGVRQGIGASHSVELRAFWNDVDDLINVVCVSGCDNADFNDDVFLAENLDRFRNRGLELTYRLVRDSWSVHASGIRQQPRDRNSGARLLRRADKTATAGFAQTLGWFEYGVDALASGDRIDFGGARLGGYVLMNLTAGVRIGEHVRLLGRLENLLDRDYQTAAGYDQAGRSAYVTLRYSL